MDSLVSNVTSNYPQNIYNPHADFKFTSPISGTLPLSVSFTNESRAAITLWTWAFGDGDTSRQQNPIHVYKSSGYYNVTLYVANCFGMDYIIKNVPVSVGMKEQDKQMRVNLFPNPAEKEITLTWLDNQKIVSIKIIDGIGKELIGLDNLQNTSETINISDLPAGLYFVEVTSRKNLVYKKLIIK